MPSTYVCNNRLCKKNREGNPCKVGCIIDGIANYCAGCDGSVGALGELVRITVVHCKGGRE
jgi:hypothetical protein